jgi:penicillin-binding protein 1B
VIWIGFDDNRDLGLPGGTTAAPMWADFMIRATTLPSYREVRDFAMPGGVQSVTIDPESLELATANCPTTKDEVYVAGSAPTELCELHNGRGVGSSTGAFLSHIFGGGGEPKPPAGQIQATPGAENTQGGAEESKEAAEKKKSPLQKIFGIFGDKKKKDPDKPKRDQGDSP